MIQVSPMTPQQLLENEDPTDAAVVTELDISHLVIEDDTPVDNLQSAQQQRLLVEPLYSSNVLPRPFLADANVGLFYKLYGEPIVPDVLLSLGVERAADYSDRRHRSYFVWEFGKVPEVCIEIVSNKEGSEVTLSAKAQREGKRQSKKDIYAQIGVPYYGVFDPLEQIQGPEEMADARLRVWSLNAGRYEELTPAQGIVAGGQSVWLDRVGLGLMLWEGPFEDEVSRLWLRWCDRESQVILTGAEGQVAERQRADVQQQRAERLAARLRDMGVDPDEV
ncbi:Uma2 family endonuclease [Oscillatoria sp. CS-180]|uniref:Uma2 family endonuclease n=1 Tax=Oscillatoria sp. CS-180 TaxID=3021720 RepID=UPI00232E29EB|nr:Uma2 family endonuclease [Oscillatoria sp. CS-180]MDB9529935.1 Uma2 family endonuclease [Oscillatoria sp. CS-180]